MAQASRKRTRSKQRPTLPAIPWRRLLRWGASLMLLLGTGAALTWGVDRLRDPNILPIRLVQIDGNLRYLDRRVLQRAVTQRAWGGFFTVDLNAVRERALRLAWISGASVRRVWPDTLKMTVTEQVPLARWGKNRLVSPQGKIFRPEDGRLPTGLPVLSGPDAAATEVARGLQRLQTILDARGLRIAALRRSARGAWRLTLTDGVLVKLGSRGVESRLRRFVRWYPQLLAAGKGVPKAVDLRYANGMAVRRVAPGGVS